MHLSPEGLELETGEAVDFFGDHIETSTIALYDANGKLVGDIIAITHDNRFVLSVDADIPTGCDVISRPFQSIRVQAVAAAHYTVIILT